MLAPFYCFILSLLLFGLTAAWRVDVQRPQQHLLGRGQQPGYLYIFIFNFHGPLRKPAFHIAVCSRLPHLVWGRARAGEGVCPGELPGGSGAGVDHAGAGKVTHPQEPPLCPPSKGPLCVPITRLCVRVPSVFLTNTSINPPVLLFLKCPELQFS